MHRAVAVSLTLPKSADTNGTPLLLGALGPMKIDKDALMIGQASDGHLVRRPLSPHLGVYRPQLTSVLSIMNRVTGIATSVGTLMLVWWLVAAAAGPHAFSWVQWFLATPVGLFMLFGWTASLLYHLFGGLRHLAWDAGWGYELDKTHMTGWAAIIATVVCTLLVWIVGLVVLGHAAPAVPGA